jgi:alpha-glucosidase
MQWAPGPGAGFCPTGTEPWLPVAGDAGEVNAAVQARDGGSMLAWYRRLLALRRAEPAVALGSYTLLHRDDDVLAYERRHGHRRVTVALNFSGRPRTLQLPGATGARVLLATGPGHRSRPTGPAIRLAGHEGVALGTGDKTPHRENPDERQLRSSRRLQRLGRSGREAASPAAADGDEGRAGRQSGGTEQ